MLEKVKFVNSAASDGGVLEKSTWNQCHNISFTDKTLCTIYRCCDKIFFNDKSKTIVPANWTK